jgi:hypothetical protein
MPITTRGVCSAAACFATVAAMLVCALPGGLLNHIRGGWFTIPQILGDGDFSHDLALRLIFAVPTGAMLVLYWPTSRPSACAALTLLGAIVALWTMLSLFTGWGSYFSMGTNPDEYEGRVGAYDWLLGSAQPSWAQQRYRRWIRDAAGMALRGLQQTALPGFALYLFSGSLAPATPPVAPATGAHSGSGRNSAPGWAAASAQRWLRAAAVSYALSGVGMAAVYELGQDAPLGGIPAFAGGIPTAELAWGWYTWASLCLPLAVLLTLGSAAAPLSSTAPTPAQVRSTEALPAGRPVSFLHAVPAGWVLSAAGSFLTFCCCGCRSGRNHGDGDLALSEGDSAGGVESAEEVLCPCLPLPAPAGDGASNCSCCSSGGCGRSSSRSSSRSSTGRARVSATDMLLQRAEAGSPDAGAAGRGKGAHSGGLGVWAAGTGRHSEDGDGAGVGASTGAPFGTADERGGCSGCVAGQCVRVGCTIGT